MPLLHKSIPYQIVFRVSCLVLWKSMPWTLSQFSFNFCYIYVLFGFGLQEIGVLHCTTEHGNIEYRRLAHRSNKPYYYANYLWLVLYWAIPDKKCPPPIEDVKVCRVEKLTWKSRQQNCVKVWKSRRLLLNLFGNHGNCDKNLEFGQPLSKISESVV